MWRLALLGFFLSLSGCEFSAWRDLPFVAGSDPYMPPGASENLRRAQGIPVNVEPLQQEPGNVWPGPVEAQPTLETLEKSGGQLPNAVPPPELPPQRGSPAPPAGAPPAPLKIPPVPPAATPANPPVAGTPLYQTPQGPGVPSGGTSAYQTVTLPNGTTAIVVPNGNGTSTIIKSDGTVQTVPTPK